MIYRPEIDGLRAIAVIPVIIFHAGLGVFAGGYVGVDVFFVISGYLITTIILDDLDGNSFSLSLFYERRARRILPALVVVVIASLCAGFILLNPIEMRALAESALSVAVFGSNIYFWLGQGYFEESVELMPLIHTWSLAIEEQFYLVFPIVLMVLASLRTKNKFMIFVVLFVVSLSISIWASNLQSHPRVASGSFFLLPSRGWELLLGALASLIVRQRNSELFHWNTYAAEFLSGVGLIAIITSAIAFDQNTLFPGWAALIPTTGTFLIVVFGTANTHVGRLLGTRPLVWIGLISYSLYLWHQPVFAFFRHYQNSVDLSLFSAIALIAISAILAIVTWKIVELPFREKKFLKRRTIFVVSLLALFTVAGLGQFGRQATHDYENWLAKDLARYNYVYFGNINERIFTQSRIFHENRRPKTLVMGSSRAMQVDNEVLGTNGLNLSVSAASVEDYIALVGAATSKFQIVEVYLGADPWLFNENSGLTAWSAIDELYYFWLNEIGKPSQANSVTTKPDFSNLPREDYKNFPSKLFAMINLSTFNAKNPENEHVAKKTFDGRHIYTKAYISQNSAQIEQNMGSFLNYAMPSYSESNDLIMQYGKLIEFLKSEEIKVSLLLSPYHPKLVDLMKLEKPLFMEIEAKFRALALKFDIPILGSYDPDLVGCEFSEFYDGMHPKKACMKRVFTK